MPPRLQAAAKYIMDHPVDFGLNTIRDTAARIGVSPNVLVRLADRMGFDSFDAFRAPFRQSLTTDREDRVGSDWAVALTDGDAFDQMQAALVQNAQRTVTRSLRLVDMGALRRAVDLISGADRCFVTATRASYAVSYYFSYAGRMAHPGIQLVPRHMGSAIDDILDAGPQDCLVAITVQPYSSETIQTLRYARQKGLRIILISDSRVIAPGVEADCVFEVSTRSMHHFSSYMGAMAVAECLLGHLFESQGEAARDRVNRYNQARENSGAYWQPSPLPRVRKP